MLDLSLRAGGYEYMDEADVVGPDLERCLVELARVNRYLGGVAGSLQALDELASNISGKHLSVLDLGTGAGDIPAAMVRWGQGKGVELSVTTIDFNPHIVAFAQVQLAHLPQVEVRREDAFALPFAADSFDIVHAGLFLHHFNAERVVELLNIMRRLGRRGLIVNDLYRHQLAYWGIRCCDALFSRSRMAQHDGPQSVLRGFRVDELVSLAKRAGVELAARRHWAFRLVVTAVK